MSYDWFKTTGSSIPQERIDEMIGQVNYGNGKPTMTETDYSGGAFVSKAKVTLTPDQEAIINMLKQGEWTLCQSRETLD